MLMLIYPSLVNRHRLVMLASISLGHRSVYKIPKVKVIASWSQVTGPKSFAYAHLALMNSSQAQTGHIGINNYRKVYKIAKVEVIVLRSQFTGSKSITYGHLPLIGSQ